VKWGDLDHETRDNLESYNRDGFHIMHNMIDAKDLETLQADSSRILDVSAMGENDFYGKNTRRSYAILAKTRSLDRLLVNPRLVKLVEALFAPNPLLAALQMIEILPLEIAQKLHYDQQFSNIGSVTRGENHVVNFMLAIDEFTEDNGATVIIPGSHLWDANRLPSDKDEKRKAIMPAGSICVFGGNLWHGGGTNTSSKARRGITIVFAQPWLRTIENHFLSIPVRIVATLDPQIQSYLGYSLHHPFTGSVDFRHPRKKLLELAEEEKNKRQSKL
jgi:ectoine hydroxylase-related dioxygenase (phytanoyl-CoA dioxygenase family)